MWILLLCAFLVALAFVNHHRNFGHFQKANVWFYPKVIAFTIILAFCKAFRCWHRRRHPEEEIKHHSLDLTSDSSSKALSFVVSDKNGNIVSVRLRRHFGQLAEVGLVIRFADGRILSHAQLPDGLTIDETQISDEAEGDCISASGLRIRAVHPMTTFRLVYSGLMRLNYSSDQFKHVTMRFWFKALADPSDFSIDYSPISLARFIAGQSSWMESLIDFFNSSVHSQQSGEMRGLLDVSGTRHELSLNGVKDHEILGSPPLSASLKMTSKFLTLRLRFEGGLIFSLHLESQQSEKLNGFVFFQNGFVYPVRWTDLTLANFDDDNIPESLAFRISTHGRLYTFSLEIISRSKLHLYEAIQNAPSSILVHEILVKAVMRGDQVEGENVGYGTLEFSSGARLEAKLPKLESQLTIPLVPASPPEIPHCVLLGDPICRISSITGGKAAKLADIVAVVSKLETCAVDFIVPDGFAVTVAAYENHLKNSPNLLGHVKNVLEISSAINLSENLNLVQNLEIACQELHDEFLNTPLTESLQKELKGHMEFSFGADGEWQTVFTAVRSSAVGEDGTEASGAGQMDTFLGRRGFNRVCEAVQLCWASHYAFRAIQYRRQLGANLDSPMAVLVQRLVKADVAGVMFTCHPDTGSTTQTLINACYGFGEGVVSGNVQPDTITVCKEDPNTDVLKIAYDVVAKKSTAYQLHEGKGVVEAEALSGTTGDRRCCLTELEIRQLYSNGKFIEKIFRSSRDIEFAVTRNKTGASSTIFILQARPVTTADLEDDWELLHQLDSPLAGDREWVTTANIQEMMPGAVAPLSAKIWIEALDTAFQRTDSNLFLKPNRRFFVARKFCCFYQHVFMNWTLSATGITNMFEKTVGDSAIFGKRVEQLDVQTFIEHNDMSNTFWKKYLALIGWKDRLFLHRGMEKLVGVIEHFKPPSSSDPATLFKELTGMMPLLKDVWYEHLHVSTVASVFPIAIMTVLDDSLNWGPQVYEDMTAMLSTCTDVFSADVPTLLQEIAGSIAKDQHARSSFLQMDRHKAKDWLLSESSGQHGVRFRNFLAKHGHRCVRDSDLREKPWRIEPEKLVDALKVMITSRNSPVLKNTQKKVLSVDEAVAAIKTPIGTIQRLAIKFLLPKGRTGVGRREWAKSLSIKMMDHYRRAVNHLATVLAEKGFLPDADLIFFLLPEEIEVLVRKRSPKLIAKALRRRKLFSKFNSMQFPELFAGHAEPINNASTLTNPESKQFNIKGTAVGQGCQQGLARVVKTLADANQIQSGDILIVPYTDVGWTPYFPMINGLVTELGGLLSHGAVVAREYGLPCLVGCKRATDLIKTGAHVYIDGHLGEIRIQDPGDKQ